MGRWKSAPRALLFEIFGVVVSPVILFFVLRLQGMAPVQLPDPYIQSAYFIDPRGISSRFGGLLTPEVIGDSARVGLLVPARILYLLFGAVPGFFVYRYLLALVAIVPVYLLLRRLYGRWAGWVGVVVVMSSPVLVATWGSDYSSAASISYLLGGQAALALSVEESRRSKPWLLAAAVLLTLSVWTNGICLLAILPVFVIYLGLRLVKDRHRLGRDTAAAIAAAVLTTGLLAVLSKLLLGWWNFVQVTFHTSRALETPRQIQLFHSSSWAWAPYDLYLLAVPAVLIAYAVVFVRRRAIGNSVLLMGMAGGGQLLLFAYLQFVGHLWLLEQPLFSCFLWAATTPMMALLVADITSPWIRAFRRTGAGTLMNRSYRRPSPLICSIGMTIPALVVLAVPLVYEAAPHAPALKWSPWGYVLTLTVILASVLGRMLIGHGSVGQRGRPAGRWSQLGALCTVALITAAVLVLTVAPEVAHGALPNTSKLDPEADYSSALGGDYASQVEEYRVVTGLPSFVGKPSYPDERLLLWFDSPLTTGVMAPIGIFGASYNYLPDPLPSLDGVDEQTIRSRHAGQILLLSTDGAGFDQAVQSLSLYGPRVVRKAVMGDSAYRLHVWLVDLAKYDSPAKAGAR